MTAAKKATHGSSAPLNLSCALDPRALLAAACEPCAPMMSGDPSGRSSRCGGAAVGVWVSVARGRLGMAGVEGLVRWTVTEKSTLLASVEAGGGKTAPLSPTGSLAPSALGLVRRGPCRLSTKPCSCVGLTPPHPAQNLTLHPPTGRARLARLVHPLGVPLGSPRPRNPVPRRRLCPHLLLLDVRLPPLSSSRPALSCETADPAHTQPPRPARERGGRRSTRQRRRRLWPRVCLLLGRCQRLRRGSVGPGRGDAGASTTLLKEEDARSLSLALTLRPVPHRIPGGASVPSCRASRNHVPRRAASLSPRKCLARIGSSVSFRCATAVDVHSHTGRPAGLHPAGDAPSA